jgi:hypothetical protein
MHLEAEIELNSERHFEAVMVRVWRCIWRPRSSNSEMHLEAEIKLNSEMHLEAGIERDWGCTSRPRSSLTQRCTWRPKSREFGDALAGKDRANLEAVIG